MRHPWGCGEPQMENSMVLPYADDDAGVIDIPRDPVQLYRELPNQIADELRDDTGCCDEMQDTGKTYYAYMSDLASHNGYWTGWLDYLEDYNISPPPSLIAYIDTMRRLHKAVGESDVARNAYLDEAEEVRRQT